MKCGTSDKVHWKIFESHYLKKPNKNKSFKKREENKKIKVKRRQIMASFSIRNRCSS
jgi:hypothetical protein